MVGAVSVGNPGKIYTINIMIAMEVDYIDDSICISKFGLSASVCLGKILNAFENHWKIL